jgi:UDP-N-acetylglucosamine 2-epimerase (non-hydrolysing)
MILITYGTRPEYIKVKPIMNEMVKQNIQFKTLFTGQHTDIVSSNPDFTIKMVNYGDNRLDNIIQNCMNLPNEWFEGISHILVQGDTTSVTGLALSAMHRKIPVIHLEAGLRTYNTENPFPEENNRRIVSTIAKIHLCPTMLNKTFLEDENTLGKIYVVGNTVLDNLVDYKSKCEYTDKVLVTIHRRENHEKINEWFTEINNLAIDYPEIEFILPIHPNPNVQKHKGILTNVTVIEPLPHEELLELLVKVKMVITDSGGLQEECSFLNKKCLVCRETTERPEAVGTSSFLIEKPEFLKRSFYHHIKKFKINEKSPYGDGKSGEKIVKILKKI